MRTPLSSSAKEYLKHVCICRWPESRNWHKHEMAFQVMGIWANLCTIHDTSIQLSANRWFFCYVNETTCVKSTFTTEHIDIYVLEITWNIADVPTLISCNVFFSTLIMQWTFSALHSYTRTIWIYLCSWWMYLCWRYGNLSISVDIV